MTNRYRIMSVNGIITTIATGAFPTIQHTVVVFSLLFFFTYYNVTATPATMATVKNKYQSVNLTKFYMKIVGFWKASSSFEQRIMDLALAYAILAIFIAITIEGMDFYYCLGDFYLLTENLCATMLLVMIVVKLSSFMYYRELIFDIISYAEINFWAVEYDEYGDEVLNECDKKAVMLTYTFCRIVECGAIIYIISPILENPGFHESQRKLPFKIWLDYPVTESPYYEVLYAIESFAALHSGICTFCFDNFVCCFNIHVAAQFKILAHKIEIIADAYLNRMAKNDDPIDAASATCDALKNCVRKHLELVTYVEHMEKAFTWILLGQLMLSSMVICFGGFQFLATESKPKKLLFVLHFFGSMSQLFIYTWTCNDITYQSEGLSTAAYNMRWYMLPHDQTGRMIKHGVFMVMNRLTRPCALTAGQFAPMSLEAFRSIVGTAASYFTILLQMSEEDI